MTHSASTVREYMTSSPHSVGCDQSLAVASKMMTTYKIRHLPVLRGGKLLGILTERDIQLLAAFDCFDPALVAVEEAMTEQPYTVAPDCPLQEVVETMAENKFGSTVVVDQHKVVGVFTTVDACRALHELLREQSV